MSELFRTFFWSKPDGDEMDMALGWLGWVMPVCLIVAAASERFA